jgi:hypothetical protein
VGASESTTGTGDDDDTAIEAEVAVVCHYDLVDVIGMKKRNGMEEEGGKGEECDEKRKEKRKERS